MTRTNTGFVIRLNSIKHDFDESYNVITDIALSYLIYILKDDIKC